MFPFTAFLRFAKVICAKQTDCLGKNKAIICIGQEKVDPNYPNTVIASIFHFIAIYSFEIPGTVYAAIPISHARALTRAGTHTHARRDARSLSPPEQRKTEEMLDSVVNL